MDSNPRVFFLDVTNIDVGLNNEEGEDSVEIIFAGKVSPSKRQRILRAIQSGNITLSEKTLV